MPIASTSHSAQEPCLYPRLRAGQPAPPKDGSGGHEQGASAEEPRPPSSQDAAAGSGRLALGSPGSELLPRIEPWDRGAGGASRFPQAGPHSLLEPPRTRSRSRSGFSGNTNWPYCGQLGAGGLQLQHQPQIGGQNHGNNPGLGQGATDTATGVSRPA
eukprot:g25593.t1